MQSFRVIICTVIVPEVIGTKCFLFQRSGVRVRKIRIILVVVLRILPIPEVAHFVADVMVIGSNNNNNNNRDDDICDEHNCWQREELHAGGQYESFGFQKYSLMIGCVLLFVVAKFICVFLCKFRFVQYYASTLVGNMHPESPHRSLMYLCFTKTKTKLNFETTVKQATKRNFQETK